MTGKGKWVSLKSDKVQVVKEVPTDIENVCKHGFVSVPSEWAGKRVRVFLI